MALSTIPFSGLGADASNQGVNFKNYVINGDLSVWQRGTLFTNASSGDFTADRWCMSYRAIGNADITQVDNKTYKSLKVNNSNGSSQEIAMRYRVEDVTQFNNNSFVLSFYAKASTSVTLDTRVYENYGSGGSSTVTLVSAGSQNKTITTTRQRFTISFTTSDMSGKTIGSSNYLEFSFHPTLVSGANWEFDSVQLEKGTVVSDFELVPYDVNLMRCYRYFFKQSSQTGQGYQSNINDQFRRFTIFYSVPMRTSPSVSNAVWNPTGSPGSQYVTTTSFQMYNNYTNTTTEGSPISYTLDAEL
jgi:hypothetical protein